MHEPVPGLLMETFTPPEGADDAWTDWYDEHRLKPRAALPGVIAARRGTALIGSVPHVVVYDLADCTAPLSAAWRAADEEAGPAPDVLGGPRRAAPLQAGPDAPGGTQPTRGVAEPPAGGQEWGLQATLYRQIFSLHEGPYSPEPTPVLHTAIFEVPSRNQDEFNDWYNTEHAAFVRDVVEGYLNIRRFQGVLETHKFTAVYDVEDIANSHAKNDHPQNYTPWAVRVRSKLPTFTERRIWQVEARA